MDLVLTVLQGIDQATDRAGLGDKYDDKIDQARDTADEKIGNE